MLPTSDTIRALADSLISPELIVFPVRHHSPACAWQLRRLLDRTRASAVLIEGPRSFTPFIPLLVHPEARMPLAIYSYAVFKPKDDLPPARHATYYPFCEHSPELVALSEASRRSIPARFIDLDFAEQCQIEPDDPESEARSLLDERRYQRSRYLDAAAKQTGCRDGEELWEHLFEVGATERGLHAYVVAMAAYSHLARSEYSDEELASDGILPREAEMAWHIREALAERKNDDGPVVAVVGGFHAVALPALLANVSKRPSISRADIADEASALIRYSFERLDRLNGYAAGMTSPAWQLRLWERTLAHDRAGIDAGARVRRDVALAFLFDIAHELRERHRVPLPMPALGAAYEHALQLAALRQRAAPVRDDVIDAVTSCFVKGDADADGGLVLAVARRAFTGNALGKVPPGASTPPLVRDYEYRARRQRLKIDDSQPRRAVLDIYRRPDHRLTSRLFHGLTLLGVPLATRTAGPDFVNGIGLDRLQEHWEYSHSPATDAALVEASIYGPTVPHAVAGRFDARLERFESANAAEAGAAGVESRDAKMAAALLVQACVLGLHDHVARVTGILVRAVAADAGFESVAAAAESLGLLWESREPLEARGIEALLPLLQATYERAAYLGRNLRGMPGDGSQIISGLLRLRELVGSEAGRGLDASLYWALVAALHTQHDAALIRGAAAGVLYCAGRMSEAELGAAVDGHLNGLLAPRDAVAFLRGLLHTAREAAWQQPALLAVLDGLLQRWDETDFVATLPELRLAFAEMTPKETDRIAEAVAQLHGERDLGRLVHYDLSDEQMQANLAASNLLVEVLKADGLQGWFAQ